MQFPAINSLIEWTDLAGKKKVERLIWIHPEGCQFYFIPVLGSRAWPFYRSRDQVEMALEEGSAKTVEVAACSEEIRKHLQLRLPDSLSATQLALLEVAWGSIKSLVMDPERSVFDSKCSGPMIRKLAETMEVTRPDLYGKRWANKKRLSRSTIYKYLRRYWQRGQTKDALQPVLDRCGGPNTRHRRGEALLGRAKCKNPKRRMNLSPADDDNFRTAIEKYFIKQKQSFQETFYLMIRDYYGETVPDGSGGMSVEKRLCHPSFAQFRYYFKQRYPKTKEQILLEREGELTVNTKYRAVIGTQPRTAFGPGAVYQIDSTVLDLNVVHSLAPNITIGRPKLYWVVDVYSTMIVGFYLGFENANYNTAGLALWNSFRDKVEVCREFNFKLKPEDWPVHGLPNMVVADRGEMLSLNAGGLIENLGIGVSNTPPYRGDLKGLVERFFKRINERSIHNLPGAVDQSGDPSKPNGRKKAVLDLHRLSRIVLALVWEFNRQLLKNYPVTARMIETDLTEFRPRTIWQWGMQYQTGMLRTMDPAFVKTALLPSIEGSITPRGLCIKGLYYSSPGRLFNLIGKARVDKTEKVKCLYDPFLVDHVYFLGRSPEELEICTLTNRTDSHRGRSWEEYRMWREFQDGKEAMGERREIQQHNSVTNIIEAEVKAAKKAQTGPVNANHVQEGQADQQQVDRTLANEATAALHGLRKAPVVEPEAATDDFTAQGCLLLENLN